MISLVELGLLILAGFLVVRVVRQIRRPELPAPPREPSSEEVAFILARIRKKREEIDRLKTEIQGLEEEITATETLAELRREVSRAKEELSDLEARFGAEEDTEEAGPDTSGK